MITLLQGDGGDGKTTLLAALTAVVTTGGALPGSCASAPAPVIYQNSEDSYSKKIRPTLDQFGANCNMIHVIDDSERLLTYADARIEETIVRTGAKLLILDPAQAFFGGANMNCAGSVRPLMKQLGDVADRHDCAVVIVGHLGKSGGKAQYRNLGSVDLFAAARSVLTLGRLDLDEDMRAFVQIKNNLTAKGKPQAFGLDNAGVFCWLGECDATTEEFDGKRKQPDNQFTKARRLIETALASGGAVAAVDIMETAEEQGISVKTVNRAKTAMGVVSVKQGGKWFWQMPVDVSYCEVKQEDTQGGYDLPTGTALTVLESRAS
jgi:predicted ATP-dependent serine protease